MKQNYRKTIRLKEYDYKSNGYYFVTIVTKNREKLLRNQEELLEKELNEVKQQISGLEIDYKVIMSNHIHIIFILENCAKQLGEIVRRFKAKVSHSMQQNIWEANYYEHVIRNEQALEKIREYIINNPLAETLKFEEFYK